MTTTMMAHNVLSAYYYIDKWSGSLGAHSVYNCSYYLGVDLMLQSKQTLELSHLIYHSSYVDFQTWKMADYINEYFHGLSGEQGIAVKNHCIKY